MGLLDEVFPQKKKEPGRIRPVKNTPTKKVPDKSSRTTTTEKSNSQPSGSSIFDSLKRVHGALSPSSKHRSTQKQDVKKSKASTEIKTVDKDRDKDKIKDRDKIKSKDKEKDSEKEKRTWFRSPSKVNLRKDPIKSSTSSLNVGAGSQKVTSSGVDSKKKRPNTGVFSDTNVTYRKGQNTKIDGQNIGDNLSRASSVTNLDAEPKVAKGAKPRKSSSRDRIDKIGESRKNDKKGITRNNNQLDSGENPYHSVDSLSEEELLHLRRQLQEMAQEKTNLALQLGEQKGQLNILQKEIQKLKEESNIQLEHLTEENTALRNRLRDVAHSPLSDNEKQQLLFDSHRHHSSAPASIATTIIDEGNGADTTCTTPDWDKHSSSNVSEVSVACLQDKINQMQETHYSTNEELQATLQELTDLQRQLTELQQENERLNEEKTLMFDSLCRQTERLNDSRSEVESLKQLLYQEKDDTGQFETAVEREQKLVDLLKSAQEEREGLLVKLEQLNNELQEIRSGIIEKDEQIGQLRERVRTLECTLDAKHAEHKLLDQELAQAKDQCSGKQIEINRLTDLLDNARTKINELEQDRALSDKSELDEMLDNARKEKDTLESEVAHLKEQLAISKNEIEKLREQVSILQEECKVTRNNAKTTQSDLEYKCEKLVKEKNVLNEQLQEFQDALNELQVQSQCQLEDKRQLSAVLSETQRNLSEAERKNLILENEVDDLKKQRTEESEEWEKFQDDLLTSVRVANDFKTEAQQELQRMILENKQYRDRERQLKAEIDKLKGGTLDLTNKENVEMDLLIKRPNRRRERSRTNSGNASSSSKSDRTPPPSQTNTVKRRENRSLRSKRLKTLSVEEEMLLKSLNSYHADIDKTIPDEFLTEEQKVIRKLKIIYEDDYLKVKPVAPKPKNQLAISKPLLDSVLTNPKLMAILKNPKVKTIEDIASFEKEAPEVRSIIRDIDRVARGKSEDLAKPEKRISVIGRSMSVGQVHEMENINKNIGLYRTVETEDLREETSPIVEHRVSSLVPSDSVSNANKRYSDFALIVKESIPESIINQNIKYSTLEKIVKTIPKNVPESKLSKEQRFALKLLSALEERKNTLKKNDKAKGLPISRPTEESVLRNPKLKEIIYDPDIKEVRRKSESYAVASMVEETLRPYKSYDNIMFTFDEKRHTVNMYNTPSETSSDTFSSAEFNVDTSEVGPYESFSASLPSPVQPRLEFVTFSKQTSLEQKESPISNNVETSVIVHKVASEKEISTLGVAPIMGELDVDIRTKRDERKPIHLDSLLYNETLKKKPKDPDTEASLTVDLLQIKIKKLTQREKSPDNNNSNKNFFDSETHTCESIHKIDNDVIYPPPIHFATVQTVDMDMVETYDSLEYNHTSKRPLKRGKSSQQVATISVETDEKIKNISEKFDEIHKLIQKDKRVTDSRRAEQLDQQNDGIIEHDVVLRGKSTGTATGTDSVSNMENDEITYDILDGKPPQSPAYDYRDILKENRVGVTPPLNYRMGYKQVVKEIKNRFSVNEQELQSLKNKSEFKSDEVDNTSRPTSLDIPIRPSSKSSIDKEMEHIFEHYLKTRVSQIIKQTEGKPKTDTEIPITNQSTPLQNNVQLGAAASSPSQNEVQAVDECVPQLESLDMKRISLLSRSYNSSENVANIEGTEDYSISGLETAEGDNTKESKLFDYSKLSPKELTFSDDSYFELKDGSAKRVVAFEDSEEANVSADSCQKVPTKNENRLFTVYKVTEELPVQISKVIDTSTEQSIATLEQNYSDKHCNDDNAKTNFIDVIPREDTNKDEINIETQTLKRSLSGPEHIIIEPTKNIRSENSTFLPELEHLVIEEVVKESSNALQYATITHDSIQQFVELTEEAPDIISSIPKDSVREYERKSFDSETNITPPTKEAIAHENKDSALLASVQTSNISLEPTNNTNAESSPLNEDLDTDTAYIQPHVNDYNPPIPEFKITLGQGDSLPVPVDQFKLTDEELNIIRRAKKETQSRPVSGLNDQDLELIQSLSLSYLGEELNCTSNTSTGIITDVDEPLQNANVKKDEELRLTTQHNDDQSVANDSQQNIEVIDILPYDTKYFTSDTAVDNNMPKETPLTVGKMLISKSDTKDLNSEIPNPDDDRCSVTPQTLPITIPNVPHLLDSVVGTDSKNQQLSPGKQEKVTQNISKTVPVSNQDAADDLEALLTAVSTSRMAKGSKERLLSKPSSSSRQRSPNKDDKIEANKSKVSPVTNTDAGDDLESLLSTISTSRNRIPKKKFTKIGKATVSSQNIDEPIHVDSQSSDKSTVIEVIPLKNTEIIDVVNDTITDKTDIEKSSLIVEIGNKASTNDAVGTDKGNIEVLDINTRTNNPADKDKSITDNGTYIATQENTETRQKTQKMSKEFVRTGDGETYNFEVKYESETSGKLEPNQFKNVINESGTLEKRTERHTILLRNKYIDRKEIKSLSLERGEKGSDVLIRKISTAVTSRPKSENLTEKRVKSFAQHFERLSKERPKKEPIYANVNVLKNQQLMSSRQIEAIEKKPLPIPRSRNHVGKDFERLSDVPSSDSHEMKQIMSEHKNFSEDEKIGVEEVVNPETTLLKVKGLPITTEYVQRGHEKQESQSLLQTDLTPYSIKNECEMQSPEDSKLETQDLENPMERAHFSRLMDKSQIRLDDSSGASSSYSVIAVTSTAERLDLRIPSEINVNPIRGCDVSTLNLFNMEGADSASIDGNDAGLYKSITEEMNKKIGYDVTYLGELSDTDSFEDPTCSLERYSQSKPKIIDFVPLDYETKSVFPTTNDIPEYQTLEREKVYHIFNKASKSKLNKIEIQQIDHADDKSKIEGHMIQSEPNTFVEGVPKSEGSSDQEKIKTPSTDLKALFTQDQTKITEIPKLNIPLVSTTPLTSKIGPPKDNKTSTFSAAKKIFQELEAKNLPKHSTKESENVRSSINAPNTVKSEVLSTVHSANKDKIIAPEQN